MNIANYAIRASQISAAMIALTLCASLTCSADSVQERASDFGVQVSQRVALPGGLIEALLVLLPVLRKQSGYTWDQKMLSSYKVVITQLQTRYRILLVPTAFYSRKLAFCDGKAGCPTVAAYVDRKSLHVISWRFEI